MIARKSALIIVIQLLNGLLGYIGLKFISLYMDPWEYGIIGFAYGFVSLFAILGSLGFDQAHIKRVSEGKDLGTCIGTFASIKFVLIGFVLIFTLLSIFIWKNVLGRGFETSLHEPAIYLLLVYFILHIITTIMTSTFNARKEISKTQIPLFLYNFIRILATIYIALNGLGVIALATTYLIGEIFNIIFVVYLFRNYPIKKPSIIIYKDYYNFAVHMAIVVVAYKIITNIDKVFIQLFWSSQQVGEYFAIFNLSQFIILFSSAISALLLPTVSAHHVKNNIKEIKNLVLKSERYLSMIVFPIIILLIVLAEPIIHILLSDKYLTALPILQILPVFVILAVLSSPYQSKFQGMNKPQYARNRVIIMVIINIVLNILFIPRDIQSIGLKLLGLGAKGAAIATVLSYLAGFIYIRIVSWKKTQIKGNVCVIYHGITAITCGGIVSVISRAISISRWYELLAITIVGLGLYFIILFLIKEFKKEDFNLFIDVLNIKKMLKYMREEFRNE